MSRRLFIFAAYDPRGGVVDSSLIDYVRSLSKIGDVVLYMDNNAPESELSKIRPFVLYAGASKHGEYDFGSYKRAYIWAYDNLKLSDYDWVYFANDSVYAPLHPVLPILKKLESRGTDAVGMVMKKHKSKPHIQSWFFGMTKTVFMSDEFDAFIRSVEKQTEKGMVTHLYENGFTRLLIKNHWSWAYEFTVTGHGVYNNVKSLFVRGLPFMKKAAFSRRHGSLGRQVLYILNHVDNGTKKSILENANRVYGNDYVNKFLTKNIFVIMYRNVWHSLYKLFVEGI